MEMVRCPEQLKSLLPTICLETLSQTWVPCYGGIGLAASGNIHPGRLSFEPVHGSAPTIAGKGIANPLAAILTVGMMYTHLGYDGLNKESLVLYNKHLKINR